jgi:hypothetical protein
MNYKLSFFMFPDPLHANALVSRDLLLSNIDVDNTMTGYTHNCV